MKAVKTKFIIIIFASICVWLTGCANKEKENIPNQFESITISDDYLINEECTELSYDLQIYMIWVQHYYNHSDKKNLSSFNFSDSTCISEVEKLQMHKNDKISISQDSLVKATIVGYYLKIEYLLSEKDLLIASGTSESEDWFKKLNEELNVIYHKLSNGINK